MTLLKQPDAACGRNGTLLPEAEDIARLLSLLFEPDDLVEIRPIETWIEKGKKKQRPTSGREWLPARQVPYRYQRLLSLAEGPEHANIFFGICPRPHSGAGTKDTIRIVRCLWQDLDDCQPDEALYRVDQAGLPRPSAVIASGHGTHLYWILRTAFQLNSAEDRDRVEGDIARFADLIGGDSTQDVSRVYRLPNFPNVKDARNGTEPTMCSLIEVNEHRYDLDELEEYLPQPAAPQPAAHPAIVAEPPQELSLEIKEWVKETLSKPAKDGTRSEKDFAVLCQLRDQGWTKESCRVLTAPYSKFAERADYFELTWQKIEQQPAKPPQIVPPVAAPPAADAKLAELPKAQSFTSVLESVRSAYVTGKPIVRTLQTSMQLFDETVGGLPRGEYAALVGQPGCGKTSLVDRLVVDVLRRAPDARGIIFSLETANSVRACRLIASEAVEVVNNGVIGHVPVSALLRGSLRDHGRSHAALAHDRLQAEIGDRLQFIDSAYEASQIARIIQKEKPDLIAIDHLGLVVSGQVGESETSRMDNALWNLVAAIREVQCAAIIVNELNKGAMVSGSVDMGASRGSIRFASLAAMYIGLLQLPAQSEAETDPRIAAQLRKNRFGPSNMQQTGRFFGGYSYFAWETFGALPPSAPDEQRGNRRKDKNEHR